MTSLASRDQDLAKRAFDARLSGTALTEFPDDFSFEDALRLQLAVADRFAAQGDAIGGWKVGFTSGPSKDVMGEGFRPFGFVLASRILHSGARVTWPGPTSYGIEPELCLVLGDELSGPDVTPDQARSVVRGVAAGFELIQSRVGLPGTGGHVNRLVDGLSNWGLVMGDEIPTDEFEGRTVVELDSNGLQRRAPTTDADVALDDVFTSLAALARMLDVHGRSLQPGQIILTGAFCKEAVTSTSSWIARFAGVGSVAVTLSVEST